MEISKKDSIITIVLTDEECEIYDFMCSLSSIFFQTALERLFVQRKKQKKHEEDKQLLMDIKSGNMIVSSKDSL